MESKEHYYAGWSLSWLPQTPNTIYVADEKNGSWSDSAIYVGGKLLYDFQERVPSNVQKEVKKFFREIRKGL